MNIENLRQKVAIVANNSILRSNRVKNCVHVWMWKEVVLVENEEKRRHLANIRVRDKEKYRCSIFSMLKKRDDDSLLVGSTIFSACHFYRFGSAVVANVNIWLNWECWATSHTIFSKHTYFLPSFHSITFPLNTKRLAFRFHFHFTLQCLIYIFTLLKNEVWEKYAVRNHEENRD